MERLLQWSKCLIFNNNFKNKVFQRRQKALSWSKGLNGSHYSDFLYSYLGYEPQQEISNNAVLATSKASDQPAHMHSLIRAFASRLNIL